MFEITFRIGLNKASYSMVQGVEPVSYSRLKLREEVVEQCKTRLISEGICIFTSKRQQ